MLSMSGGSDLEDDSESQKTVCKISVYTERTALEDRVAYRAKQNESDSDTKYSFRWREKENDSDDIAVHSAEKSDSHLTPGRAREKIFKDLDLTVLRGETALSSTHTSPVSQKSEELLNKTFDPDLVPRNLSRPDQSMLVHRDEESGGKDSPVHAFKESPQDTLNVRRSKKSNQHLSSNSILREPTTKQSVLELDEPVEGADSDFDFEEDKEVQFDDLDSIPEEPISSCSQDQSHESVPNGALSQESSSRRKLTYESTSDEEFYKSLPHVRTPPPNGQRSASHQKIMDNFERTRKKWLDNPPDLLACLRETDAKIKPVPHYDKDWKRDLRKKGIVLLEDFSPMSGHSPVQSSPVQVGDDKTPFSGRSTPKSSPVQDGFQKSPFYNPRPSSAKKQNKLSTPKSSPHTNLLSSVSPVFKRRSKEIIIPKSRSVSTPKSLQRKESRSPSKSKESWRLTPFSQKNISMSPLTPSQSPPKKRKKSPGIKSSSPQAKDISKRKERSRSFSSKSPDKEKEASISKSISSYKSPSKKRSLLGSPAFSESRSRSRERSKTRNDKLSVERSISRESIKSKSPPKSTSPFQSKSKSPQNLRDASPFHSLLSGSSNRSPSLEIVNVDTKSKTQSEQSPLKLSKSRSQSPLELSQSRSQSPFLGEVETPYGKGKRIEENFMSEKVEFSWGVLELPKGDESRVGSLIWETSRFQKQDIRNSSGRIYLFGDNDMDFNRSSSVDRGHFGGMASACGAFDRTKAFGIITTFYDGERPDIDDFRDMLEKQFRRVRKFLSHGIDVVIPAPNADDLTGLNKKKYLKRGKHIINHNLGTGIANLPEKHLLLIEELLQELIADAESGKISLEKAKIKVSHNGKAEVPESVKKLLSNLEKRKASEPRVASSASASPVNHNVDDDMSEPRASASAERMGTNSPLSSIGVPASPVNHNADNMSERSNLPSMHSLEESPKSTALQKLPSPPPKKISLSNSPIREPSEPGSLGLPDTPDKSPRKRKRKRSPSLPPLDPDKSSRKRKRSPSLPPLDVSISREKDPPKPKKKRRNRKEFRLIQDGPSTYPTVMKGNRRVRRKGMPKTTFGEEARWDEENECWTIFRDDRPKPVRVVFGSGRHKMVRNFSVPFSVWHAVEHYIDLQYDDALTDDETEEKREFVDSKLKTFKKCPCDSLAALKDWFQSMEKEQIRREREKGGKPKKRGKKRKLKRKKKHQFVVDFEEPCSEDFKTQAFSIAEDDLEWNECQDGVDVAWDLQSRQHHIGRLRIAPGKKYDDNNETELLLVMMKGQRGKVWLQFDKYRCQLMETMSSYKLEAGIRYSIDNKSKWGEAIFTVNSMNPHQGYDEYPNFRGFHIVDLNEVNNSESEPEGTPKKRRKSKNKQKKTKSKSKNSKKKAKPKPKKKRKRVSSNSEF